MTVNVVMTSFFTDDVPTREKYALESLASLVDNLYCSDGLRLILSDDSATVKEVCNKLLKMPIDKWKNISVYSNSNHRGIGASLNASIHHINDYWLYTTDDWRLEAPLNLDGPLKMLASLDYDLVRLGPVHPDLQCTTRFNASVGWWLDIAQHYGGFAFATRPFIATKKFYEKIGPFDEGLNSYETERLYAERVAKSTAKLAYWGGVNLSGPWMHVGNDCVGYLDV